jgi:hypothetical protein
MLSYKSSRYQPVALPPERGSQRLHARRPRSCAFPPAPRGGESESSAPTVAALRSSGDIIASAKFSLTWSILVVNSLWLCLMSAESSLSIVANPAQATIAPRPKFSIGKERLSRPFGLASFEVASSFGLEYAAEARTRRCGPCALLVGVWN